MALKDQLSGDLKDAMRAKDKLRVGTLRMAMAAIKQREVDERIELDDTQILAVLEKMLKQRKDSFEQYDKAGRDDLAQQEQQEMEILKAYMPAALSEAEIDALIDKAITATGASGMADMGKVMGTLKPEVQGRADMKALSAKVRGKLG